MPTATDVVPRMLVRDPCVWCCVCVVSVCRLTSARTARYRSRHPVVNEFAAESSKSNQSMQDSSGQVLTSDGSAGLSCNPAPAGEGTSARVVEVALTALFRRQDGRTEVLVARRHAEAIRGGLWELPGGKIEAGEPPVAAALREVAEEVGLASDALLTAPSSVMVVEHSDPEVAREKSVRLHAFLAEVKPTVEPRALGASEVRWVPVDRLAELEWPKANAPINDRLREILR